MLESKLVVLVMTERDKRGNERYRNLKTGEIIEKEELKILDKYPECVDFTSGKPTMRIECENSSSETTTVLLLDYKLLPCSSNINQKHLYFAYIAEFHKL